MHYGDFFARATGNRPYQYQRMLAAAEWPDALIAPTGLGKTAAVILGWLWHRRDTPKTTPRRLVYCLPMRTLVEQTAENVDCWLRRLNDAGLTENLPSPDGVHVLMGGIEPCRDRPRWYELPEHPAILIGTQDMLISRALMRGYAAGRARWPTEFALLHNDTQWIFDEVQLMGAGLATSTQLNAFRDSARLESALPTHSLWLSATLDPEWLRTVDFPGPGKILRVPDDVPEDSSSADVRRLIEAYKPLTKAATAPTGTKKTEVEGYIRALTAFVRKIRVSGERTLVIVNTVDRAQNLYAALLKAGTPESELVLVHSRFRPSDRRAQMERLRLAEDCIVVATQAIEAGVDLSSAALITELAPWPSLVQRFGRVNRRGERAKEDGGAPVYWIDLPDDLAAPYEEEEFAEARVRLSDLRNAAPVELHDPGRLAPPRRVIRRKDLIDLFDTDPDLTGFDVDISPYVRDASDTDVHVFWRDLNAAASDPVRPSRDELCAVSIGKAKDWIAALRKAKLPVYAPDPLWRKGERGRAGIPPGWQPLDGLPWPGMTLLADSTAGGYDPALGFIGEAAKAHVTPAETPPPDPTETDHEDGDPGSDGFPAAVSLAAHTSHVVDEAQALCLALGIGPRESDALLRAARWHDLGKAHPVFQETMHRGLRNPAAYEGVLLAKCEDQHLRHGRTYFRHELASALAFLAHESWRRDADLVAYLIAAHHGKVRMSIRALPAEPAPPGPGKPADDRRFARGIWEDDELPPVDLGAGEAWAGGKLTLSVMELGEHEITGASWTERTRALLDRCGPFRLAWLEALLTIADWRASAKERNGGSRAPHVPGLGGPHE